MNTFKIEIENKRAMKMYNLNTYLLCRLGV